MTVLLDSWAWIEYFKGTSYGKEAKKFIEGDEEILVSVINIAEVYGHFLRNKDEDAADSVIKFISKRSFIIPVITKIAINAAKIKYEKKWGLGDALIYATAEIHKIQIMTGDPDFKDEDNVIYIGKA